MKQRLLAASFSHRWHHAVDHRHLNATDHFDNFLGYDNRHSSLNHTGVSCVYKLAQDDFYKFCSALAVGATFVRASLQVNVYKAIHLTVIEEKRLSDKELLADLKWAYERKELARLCIRSM
eukprot:5385500-Amphidinium_carterae.1